MYCLGEMYDIGDKGSSVSHHFTTEMGIFASRNLSFVWGKKFKTCLGL